jgi:hypothetical protein
MTSQVPKTEIDRGRQMENSFWGFDPVTEFDSSNPSEHMEANSLKQQRSALAPAGYPANSSQSPPLPVQDVSSAIHSQEPKIRTTNRLDTKNGQREDEYWGFDPVLRSTTSISMKSAPVEGS